MAALDSYGISCSTRPSSPEPVPTQGRPPGTGGDTMGVPPASTFPVIVPATHAVTAVIGPHGGSVPRVSGPGHRFQESTVTFSSAGSSQINQPADGQPPYLATKWCPTCGRDGSPLASYALSHFGPPGGYPRPLAYDSPNEVLDSISIPVVEASDDGCSAEARTRPPSPGWRNGVELGLTFVIVVSMWGAIDVCAELLSFDILAMELMSYGTFTLIALAIIMLCNKCFNSRMSIAGGLSRF